MNISEGDKVEFIDTVWNIKRVGTVRHIFRYSSLVTCLDDNGHLRPTTIDKITKKKTFCGWKDL